MFSFTELPQQTLLRASDGSGVCWALGRCFPIVNKSIDLKWSHHQTTIKNTDRHGRNSEEGKGVFQKDFTKGNFNLNLKNEIGLGVLERIKRVFFFFFFPKNNSQVRFLGQEDPLEKKMTTHSCILAWRIPWTEEPGGLQSTGLQKDWT